jgi:anti-sigma regulatory factor (Ser/Thr protein kinase)
MRKTFKRNHRTLNAVFDFIKQSVSALKLDADTIRSLSIAVEEIFTNMIKYNTNAVSDIMIDIHQEGDVLKIIFVDHQNQPFDITRLNNYDPTLPLDKRPVGKVGLRLVKKIMDDVQYEFKDNQSKIILIKKL